MAKNKPGGSVGGFVFNVFNVGFTVFMFILPTIGLVYWYMYIRDPGGAAPQPTQVTVREIPAASEKKLAVESKTAAPNESKQPLTSGFFDELSGPREGSSDTPSGGTANVNPPARQAYEMRTWSDASGEFSVQARFYSASGEGVKLIAENDRAIEVPIAKLSDDDKEYLRTLFRQKGIRPSF